MNCLRREYLLPGLHIVSDVVLVTFLLVFAIMHKYFDGKPVWRGFFCDEMSIRLPYLTETYGGGTVKLVALGLPLGIIIFVEIFRIVFRWFAEERTFRIQYVEPFYEQLIGFLFGYGACYLLTSYAKTKFGRLRPHFFEVCRPTFAVNNGTCAPGLFVSDYVCSNPDFSPRKLLNTHLSFPSGHTSLCTYSMVFLVIYIERRLHNSPSMPRHVLQLALVVIAWVISLSRISEHMHHWSDVLAGAVIGISLALIVSLYVVKHVLDIPKGIRAMSQSAIV